MAWYHKKLKRRIKKGSLPEWANVYKHDEHVDELKQAECSKIYRDIEKYDKDNQQTHLSSGGRKRRRTKRRRTKRRRTKRRRTRRTKRRKRTKRRRKRRK